MDATLEPLGLLELVGHLPAGLRPKTHVLPPDNMPPLPTVVDLDLPGLDQPANRSQRNLGRRGPRPRDWPRPPTPCCPVC